MTRAIRVAATALLVALAAAFGGAPASAKILVPMDERQTDHLKAYGLAYWTLTKGARIDWLLNYRGGSFLMPDNAIKFSAATNGAHRPPPTVSQHADEVLAELGLDPDERERLYEAGSVVRGS